MSAVAITPGSGSITSKMSVCKVNVTDATVNDPTTFNASNSPSEDAILYYIELSKAGASLLISQRFTPSSDGLFEWDNIIFPSDGEWAVSLKLDADDTTIASIGATVS